MSVTLAPLAHLAISPFAIDYMADTKTKPIQTMGAKILFCYHVDGQMSVPDESNGILEFSNLKKNPSFYFREPRLKFEQKEPKPNEEGHCSCDCDIEINSS